MKSQDFTYAVSRIRIKETKLLKRKEIGRLIAQQDYNSLLRVLAEFGYNCKNSTDISEILSLEQRKLWALMEELVDDMSVFDVFRIQNDYHNLKASVKSVYCDTSAESILVSGGTLAGDFIYECVKNRDYQELPSRLSETASKAMDVLLKTGDGQLCDIIIDKASLDALSDFADNVQHNVIKDYAELYIASANIKIAVRGSKLNKSPEFFGNALAECKSLNKELLAKSATKGFDEVCVYLSKTKYKDCVEYIKKSMSSFEKWCDDLITKGLGNQKYEPFNIGPLVAYILAKQNEIKAVRLILISKINGLDESKVNERIREMYE